MGTRGSGLRLAEVLGLALLLGPVCWGQPDAASQEGLLESLVAKNEAAWQRIQTLTSIQYTLERQWLDRESRQPFRGVAQVRRQRDGLWSACRIQVHTGPLQVVKETERTVGNRTFPMKLLAPDTSAGQTGMTERRVVVNGQYVAEWPAAGNPLAYRYDHNSVDTMSPKMRAHLARSLPPDFLQSCFGESRRRFPEALRTASDRRKYDAIQHTGEDGGRLYQIRRFYPPWAAKPDVVWVIDPQRGYLATECRFSAQGEVPVYRHKMRVEQIAPGIWFPVEFEETRYAEPNRPGEPPRVETWSRITLKDIQVNESIPDEQFEIEALGLRNVTDLTVMRTTVDGRTIPYVYREGKLVPKE